MTRITTEPTELSTISSIPNNGYFNIVGNATFNSLSKNLGGINGNATFNDLSTNLGSINGTITCAPSFVDGLEIEHQCNVPTCTITLSGDDGPNADPPGPFEISGNKLRLKTGTQLQYAQQSKYSVTIDSSCDNSNHPEFTLHILPGVAP